MLRSLGMTTIFGNPGSTELPFLEDFPEDFTYALGLQESVVLAMADGYAQAKRHATLVNLHTAPGLGNAMGAMVNAFHGRTPLVITAGQQDRRHLALEPLLHGRLVELAKPYVKWSHEPARAEDVPAAVARAYHTATQEPQGPVFVSIPMDDWEAGPHPSRHARSRNERPPTPKPSSGWPTRCGRAGGLRSLPETALPAAVRGTRSWPWPRSSTHRCGTSRSPHTCRSRRTTPSFKDTSRRPGGRSPNNSPRTTL